MPELDLRNVPDADEFKPVPVGKFLCRIDSIDDSLETKNKDEMWGLILVVIEGACEGKQIRDNISFGNETAIKRVKHLCSQAGIDLSKKFTLKPSMLTGKLFYVEVDGHREYEDKKGKMRKAASVAFAGYEMVDAETEARVRKGGKADEPWANGKPKSAEAGGAAASEEDPF